MRFVYCLGPGLPVPSAWLHSFLSAPVGDQIVSATIYFDNLQSGEVTQLLNSMGHHTVGLRLQRKGDKSPLPGQSWSHDVFSPRSPEVVLVSEGVMQAPAGRESSPNIPSNYSMWRLEQIYSTAEPWLPSLMSGNPPGQRGHCRKIPDTPESLESATAEMVWDGDRPGMLSQHLCGAAAPMNVKLPIEKSSRAQGDLTFCHSSPPEGRRCKLQPFRRESRPVIISHCSTSQSPPSPSNLSLRHSGVNQCLLFPEWG